MNILEHYIAEVHNVKPYTEEWTKDYPKQFVKVDVTGDCYGTKKRFERIWTTDEWREILNKGYWLE